MGIRQWFFSSGPNPKLPSEQFTIQDASHQYAEAPTNLEQGPAPKRITRQFRYGLSGWASLTQHGWPSTWLTEYLPPPIPTARSMRAKGVYGSGTLRGSISGADSGKIPSVYIPVVSV